MKYTINHTKDEAYRYFLKQSIKTFNNVNSPLHKEARKEGYIKYFDIRLEDETQGGMCGSIYWNLMEIDDFFISDNLRAQGYGSLLLQEAIKMATEKKLSYILLKTFSFQAKDFYQKYGFRVIGEIKDYPPGEIFYTMKYDI